MEFRRSRDFRSRRVSLGLPARYGKEEHRIARTTVERSHAFPYQVRALNRPVTGSPRLVLLSLVAPVFCGSIRSVKENDGKQPGSGLKNTDQDENRDNGVTAVSLHDPSKPRPFLVLIFCART